MFVLNSIKGDTIFEIPNVLFMVEYNFLSLSRKKRDSLGLVFFSKTNSVFESLSLVIESIASIL